MATNFPGALDTLTNPTGGSNLNTAGVIHADEHANANDAVEALEAKVGIDASAVTSSLDWQVHHHESVRTADYVLVLGDVATWQVMNVAGANTLTIPTNASAAFPIGTVIPGFQLGAGQTTLTPAGGVTLKSAGGKLKSAVQYSWWELRKRGADDWFVRGDLTT